MKPFALVAAAAGTVVVLAACSHSAATSAAPAAPSTVSPSAASPSTATHPVTPVNCPQRYDAWRHGPAKKVIAAIDDAVNSAGKAASPSVRTAAVKKAGPAVAKAARYP